MSPSPFDFQLAQPEAPVLAAARFSACARARYADDAVVNAGIEQVIVVGAGLDTTQFRLPTSARRQVWLLDLPHVLAWRTQVFAQAGVTDSGRTVPVDLTEGVNPDELAAAGLNLRAPVVVLWLGVSMYLKPAGCRRFFEDLARLQEGSMLIFDYLLPPAYATKLERLTRERWPKWPGTLANRGGVPQPPKPCGNGSPTRDGTFSTTAMKPMRHRTGFGNPKPISARWLLSDSSPRDSATIG